MMYTVDPGKIIVLAVLAVLISQIDMSAVNLRIKTSRNSYRFYRKDPSGLETRTQQRRLYRRQSWVDTKLNCFTWSAWTNDHHPSPTDEEKIPYTSLDKFCDPMYAGEVTDVECREDNSLIYSKNKTSSDGKYFVECNKEEVFAKCSILDASLVKCPDLSLRYYCHCDPVLAGVTLTSTVTVSTKPTSSEQTSPMVKSLVTHRTKNVSGTVTPSSTQVKSSTQTIVTRSGSTQSNGNIVQITSYIKPNTSAPESTSRPVVSKANVTKFASTSVRSSPKMSITNVPYQRTRTTQDHGFQISSPKSTAGTNTARSSVTGKEKNGFNVAGVYISWWIVTISASFLFCVFNAFLTLCLFRRARKKAKDGKKKVHKWHDSIAPNWNNESCLTNSASGNQLRNTKGFHDGQCRGYYTFLGVRGKSSAVRNVEARRGTALSIGSSSSELPSGSTLISC